MENQSQNNESKKIDIEKLNKAELKELCYSLIESQNNFNEEAQKIKTLVDTLKSDSESFKDKWMRSVAEFENYKKRNSTLRTCSIEEGKAQILLKFLPIGDNLDRALSVIEDEKTKDGIKLIIRGFNEVLEKEDITVINPINEPFDPMLHEAIMQVEAEEGDESGNVKDVYLKGYKMGDKVIRYAQVRVIA